MEEKERKEKKNKNRWKGKGAYLAVKAEKNVVRPPEAPLEVSPENSRFESLKMAKCQSEYCGFGRI